MATYTTLVGNEVASPTLPRSQVYKATHEEGGKRLPFMYRSFISFTYGGKHIEDFNLIAVTNGDRMEREGYAEFEDLISTYDTINGQFYWGTYFHQNTLDLTLATDGITQNQLDDFKRWFRAGSIRELILAEHPNRAILARIAQPPHLRVLPFEQNVTVPFYNEVSGDRIYTTSTTLYKGEIDISFVMDDPFWYSVKNILGEQNVTQGYYEESWHDADGQLVSIRNSPDALKIVYEDRIPLGSTTAVDVFLGGDTYASVKYEIWSLIAAEPVYELAEWEEMSRRQGELENSDEVWSYSREQNPKAEERAEHPYIYYKNAHIAKNINGGEGDDAIYAGARIGGASLTDASEGHGVDMRHDDTAHLYYAGTAPSPVKLRFTLTPAFAGNYYMTTPGNKHSDGNPYNTITLEATEKHEFKFTLPTIWLSYNQALEIFDSEDIIKVGFAWLTVRETIRKTIRHPVVRAWANMLINKYDNAGGSGIISEPAGDGSLPALRGDLKEGMQMLFMDNTPNSSVPFPATFLFDGKTGLAIGTFTYRDINKVTITNDNVSLPSQIKGTTDEDYTITQEENVGDMVKSSYLILDERNVLDNYYRIQKWEEEHPDYAYKITHDVSTVLQSIHFEFKNLYL